MISNKNRMPTFTVAFNSWKKSMYSQHSCAKQTKKRERNEKHPIGKEKVAPSLPEDGMILLLEIPNNHKNLTKGNTIQQSCRLQDQHIK